MMADRDPAKFWDILAGGRGPTLGPSGLASRTLNKLWIPSCPDPRCCCGSQSRGVDSEECSASGILAELSTEPGLPSGRFRPTLWNVWTTSRVRLRISQRRPKLNIELIKVSQLLIRLPAGLREADSV